MEKKAIVSLGIKSDGEKNNFTSTSYDDICRWRVCCVCRSVVALYDDWIQKRLLSGSDCIKATIGQFFIFHHWNPSWVLSFISEQ